MEGTPLWDHKMTSASLAGQITGPRLVSAFARTQGEVFGKHS